MNRYPAKHMAADLEKAERSEIAPEQLGSGFSFRYAYREVTISGGTTRIRSREQRFEDGKFQSEEFDGTTDGAVYHDAVRATQGLVTSQVDAFFKVFSALTPFSRSR